MSNFFGVSDDILNNIMSRLPAKSFAAAACVNHFWNRVSDLILSRPRFLSGLSLAVSSEIAVNEALEMALSKPIRPHFAIAFVGLQFPKEEIHEQITRKIGANTILITCAALGIIGIDSITNELEEVKWEYDNEVDDAIYRGITLVIGFVPGLKITVLPLLHTNTEPEEAMVDKFISDVRDFTVSVSGDTNPDPVGIMLFGDHSRNLKPILAEIDTKISRETAMIGDVHSYFICTSAAINNLDTTRYSLDAVALVFARDNQNTEVEIKFHVAISKAIIPVSPKSEIIDVKEYSTNTSFLSVKTEGQVMPLDASTHLLSLYPLMEDKVYFLYLGVTKETVPQDGGTPIKYTEFHEIIGALQNKFIISGSGIDHGDTCMFYHSDINTAKGSSNNVYNRFNSLIEPPRLVFGQLIWSDQNFKEKVFGGILFASSNRGKIFFGNTMTDCMPFSENFPEVPLGGMFCAEPIGRSAVLEEKEWLSEEERFNLQVFNAVHLVMSYKTSGMFK